MNQDIFQRVVVMIVNYLDLFKDDIKPESCLVTDFGCSSIDLLCFSVEIEREFNVIFLDEDVKKINNVGNLVNLIEKKLE